MNTSIFYLTSIVWSVAGFVILWQLGFKKLLLDNFRDQLFGIRDRLYDLAQDGRISCDDEAYRAVETLLNGLIRYAHRITLATLMLHNRESERMKDADEQTFSDELRQKISHVEDGKVSEELLLFVDEISRSIVRYAAKSSVPFMAATMLYLLFHFFVPAQAMDRKTKAVSTFERGAYAAAERSRLVRA